MRCRHTILFFEPVASLIPMLHLVGVRLHSMSRVNLIFVHLLILGNVERSIEVISDLTMVVFQSSVNVKDFSFRVELSVVVPPVDEGFNVLDRLCPEHCKGYGRGYGPNISRRVCGISLGFWRGAFVGSVETFSLAGLEGPHASEIRDFENRDKWEAIVLHPFWATDKYITGLHVGMAVMFIIAELVVYVFDRLR